MRKVKGNLTQIYHEEILANLAAQSLDRDNRYKPATATPIGGGDIVLIKENFSKPHTYPLGKVIKIYKNINDEVTNVEVLKGSTREVTKRQISSIIPLLESTEVFHEQEVTLNSHAWVPPKPKPRRLAAIISQQKTKQLLDTT